MKAYEANYHSRNNGGSGAGSSLNQAVLELLRQSLGLQSGRYENGLAKFAATWTPKDLLDFEHSIEIFERVDPELWK
jgi:hypothetical protein